MVGVFDISLTVHLSITLANDQRDVQVLNTFITILYMYMFRAISCSLLGGQIGWNYHSKHVEQFPDINKLCNVASCWIYSYIGILLGARPILHISRVRVNTAPGIVTLSK
jgi:hypothetical protein